MKSETKRDLSFVGLFLTGIGFSVLTYIVAVTLGVPHSELSSMLVGFTSGIIVDRLLSKE